MPPILLIAATAPVIDTGALLRMDAKFLAGMAQHVAGWPGPVRVALRRGAGAVPFGTQVARADLGFDLVLLDAGAPWPADILDGVRAVSASADDMAALDLAARGRTAGAAVVLSLEYTLGIRLRIASLDPTRGPARRAWSMLWNLRAERRRLRALRAADGVQFNGWPAWDAYAPRVRAPMLYLDNRMSLAAMASPAQMAARAARLAQGAPLRLIHSGRLEPMKGAQDLLAVMDALDAQRVPATLDIYGTGSLEGAIRAGLGRFADRVRLHGPVDFDTVLVPATQEADVFLSCHRQSDPSCTYLEAMACGAAVVGYGNRMWTRLAAESGGGAVVPMGQPQALAEALAAWHRDRDALIHAQAAGLTYAQAHDFEGEFAARMAHVRQVAGVDGVASPAPPRA